VARADQAGQVQRLLPRIRPAVLALPLLVARHGLGAAGRENRCDQGPPLLRQPLRSRHGRETAPVVLVLRARRLQAAPGAARHARARRRLPAADGLGSGRAGYLLRQEGRDPGRVELRGSPGGLVHDGPGDGAGRGERVRERGRRRSGSRERRETKKPRGNHSLPSPLSFRFLRLTPPREPPTTRASASSSQRATRSCSPSARCSRPRSRSPPRSAQARPPTSAPSTSL